MSALPPVYDRAIALFDRAIDLPPDERLAFVDRECGDDHALASRVRAMLAADDADTPLVGVSPRDLAGMLTSVPDEHRLEGRTIGQYRIIRLLGRGGMGAVFLARRDDVAKDVALKVVAGGLASPERLQRFLTERRVLARLDHPHITRLLDAGVDDDGTPWFAMELVDGLRIDRYCATNNLDVGRRLRLGEQVCRAVGFAHRNLIVHRDLKPSNILVTPDGEPRLLDFGIAKLLEETSGEPGTLTADARPMTPAYASPEQVRGEPVTTATDVYQLGVLLYELLTGQRPERDGEPRRPSELAPRDLRRRLQGDVDNIILKALAADPDHRYATAEQLADDIHRHLTGLPVVARPGTVSYRVGKFVRRHRSGVTVAAVLLATGVGFTFSTAAQSRRVARERDRATIEAVKAQRVSEFLQRLFRASDPSRALGRDLTARELLAEGARQLRNDSLLARQPVVRAALLHVLGQVYRDLDLRDEARPLLEEALALRQAHLESNDPDLAESMLSLGVLAVDEGRFAEGRPLLQSVLAIHRAAPVPDSSALARTLHSLGVLHLIEGRFDTAEVALREAIAIRRGLGERAADLLASTLDVLGALYARQGSFARAESLQTEVLAQRRARLDPLHPELARSLNNLGGTRLRMGKLAAAESSYREAHAIWVRLHPVHGDVATVLNNLGAVLERQDRLVEAESVYRDALAMKRQLFRGDDPSVASGLANLGLLLRRRGRLAEAERLLLESYAMRVRLRGPQHPDVANTAMNLARLYSERGDLAKAIARFEEALRIRRASFGDDHAATRAAALALDSARVK